MKKLFFAFLFVLSAGTAGQVLADTGNPASVSNKDHIRVFIVDKNDLDACKEIAYANLDYNSTSDNPCNQALLSYSPNRSINLSYYKVILIRCFDSSNKNDVIKSCADKIEIDDREDNNIKVPITADDFKDSNYLTKNLSDSDVEKVLDSDNGAKFKINIKGTNNTETNFYVDNRRMFRAPGLQISPDWFPAVGVWAPIGLFATNFQRTGNGMQFSASPVGLAIGTKWYPNKDKSYIGGSLITSWAIAKTDSNTGTNNNSTITAASINFGALFDLSGWVYLGGVYGIDLSSNKNNPGGMMVIGVGPKLISFFNPTSK